MYYFMTDGHIIEISDYLKKYEDALMENSAIDSITGLFRKDEFKKNVLERLKELTDEEVQEYAVAYLNFVDFKYLNINLGVAEGDVCLRTIAEILTHSFEDRFVCRLSDDHFVVFGKYEGIGHKIKEALASFYEVYSKRCSITGKCGIYRFGPEHGLDLESALSYAKAACDHIKYDTSMEMVEYSDEVAEQMRISEYVVRKLDDALKKGWIKVYYQPVVRALTGELCGMESLARWSDTEIGFLSPDRFIGILEKNRLIYKLDCYIVEQVCKSMHERVEAGEPIVPVSVNFSRLDFVMCDMLSFVEDAVERYDIPRDFLHIEITESMIASDEELMRGVIKSFRKAGYEIWMDDFGSGYSSLTLLKDYHFDQLKMDMNFLTPFTEKSQDIVSSIVVMAKDIGIKTLAEGVETKDQLDFLKEIGCGKIQGFYYGKPEPLKDLFLHMKEKNIGVETRKQRHFYDVASIQARASDVPIEIIEDDGENFRTLFMNRAYKRQIFGDEPDLSEVDRRIYHTPSPLLKKYREFADLLETTGKRETFYYTENGNYLCLRAQKIAEYNGHYLIRGSILNLTADINAKERDRLDSKLRELNQLFDVVHLMDLSDDTIKPLLGRFKYLDNHEAADKSMRERMDDFIEKNIFAQEKNRYRKFIDFSTLSARIEESRRGYIFGIFLIRQDNGEYLPEEIVIMMIPGTAGREYLYCMKPFQVTEMDDALSAIDPSEDAFADLWDNMVRNSSIKFFWKDRDRRFQGASQAFLDYFGMESLSDIKGKTSEELHWHFAEESSRDEEAEVLSKGKRILSSEKRYIVGGAFRNIITSKMPIYQRGKITGLAGYFVDYEEAGQMPEIVGPSYKDPVTGLMNTRGFLNSLLDFSLQYSETKNNFGLILVENSTQSRVLESYGKEFSDRVLLKIAEELLNAAGRTSAIGRVKGAVFSILTYAERREELFELAEKVRKAIEGITAVDDNPVTIRARLAVKLRTDHGITDENMYVQTLKEIEHS
ncbi:MAG: EAL domain-containing protein [Lachnospiraceae bacterium]|nr:EAL domain-containing protein [Lachnospiraceae bacterium]